MGVTTHAGATQVAKVATGIINIMRHFCSRVEGPAGDQRTSSTPGASNSARSADTSVSPPWMA